ncbi:MAG: hypothetical protein A2Y71_06285 [Bacteroidetes bacterium RBG_13_42_15]|nr:MAG: hypothetical protein A2Y71_06285 [Bacteroidetes bacterium RBG_13_42_15]
MNLNILERITLQGILPQQGNYINFKIINELRGELSFSEREIKDWGIKVTPNAEGKGQDFITWNQVKAQEKEIKLGEVTRNIVVAELKKLDEKGEINAQNSSLYEKFIVKGQ